MSNAVQVQGLDGVRRAMNDFNKKLSYSRAEALEAFARKVAIRAKMPCPRDTGALQDSIHNELIKNTPTMTQEDVVAGDERYVRGTGRHTYSNKEGKIITSQKSTTEYAQAVENKNGFMKHGANWAIDNIKREFTDKLISKARRKV